MERAPAADAALPGLGEDFDGVLMLTWSDWKTEPRSNRFHYGSRFARIAPVLFLQPTLGPEGSVRAEPSGVAGLDLVHLPHSITPGNLDEILRLMRERGIRKPLLWIYSPLYYAPLLAALPHAFRVFHATEDYLTPGSNWASHAELVAALRRLLADVDMIVGVSEKVNGSYVERAGFEGPVVLAPNGCDAGFFQSIAQASCAAPADRVCIYQGGINHRLDFDLLAGLADRMPDWTFRFCGNAQEDLAGWIALRRRTNVEYLGSLTPEEFGRSMCESTVGLIPFRQEPLIWNSLPLKAYEYVACGLPVVSVPIAALVGRPELFSLQTAPAEFEQAIRAAAPSRTEPAALALRTREASRNSYDDRFAQVVGRIREAAAAGDARRPPGVQASSGWQGWLSALRRRVPGAARQAARRILGRAP